MSETSDKLAAYRRLLDAQPNPRIEAIRAQVAAEQARGAAQGAAFVEPETPEIPSTSVLPNLYARLPEDSSPSPENVTVPAVTQQQAREDFARGGPAAKPKAPSIAGAVKDAATAYEMDLPEGVQRGGQTFGSLAEEGTTLRSPLTPIEQALQAKKEETAAPVAAVRDAVTPFLPEAVQDDFKGAWSTVPSIGALTAATIDGPVDRKPSEQYQVAAREKAQVEAERHLGKPPGDERWLDFRYDPVRQEFVLDAAESKDKIKRAHFQLLVAENPTAPDNEAKAAVLAEQTWGAITHVGFGLPIVDTDPHKTNDRIMTMLPDISETKPWLDYVPEGKARLAADFITGNPAYFRPFVATVLPGDSLTTTGHLTETELATYGAPMSMGIWLGRVTSVISTPGAAQLKTGGATSAAGVAWIRQGGDITQVAPEVRELLLPAAEAAVPVMQAMVGVGGDEMLRGDYEGMKAAQAKDAEGAADRVSTAFAYTGIGIAILAEPDPIGFATGGASDVGKWGYLQYKLRKLGTMEKGFEVLAAADYGYDYARAVKDVKATGGTTAVDSFQVDIGAFTAANTDVDVAVRESLRIADEAEAALPARQQALDEAIKAYQDARAAIKTDTATARADVDATQDWIKGTEEVHAEHEKLYTRAVDAKRLHVETEVAAVQGRMDAVEVRLTYEEQRLQGMFELGADAYEPRATAAIELTVDDAGKAVDSTADLRVPGVTQFRPKLDAAKAELGKTLQEKAAFVATHGDVLKKADALAEDIAAVQDGLSTLRKQRTATLTTLAQHLDEAEQALLKLDEALPAPAAGKKRKYPPSRKGLIADIAGTKKRIKLAQAEFNDALKPLQADAARLTTLHAELQATHAKVFREHAKIEKAEIKLTQQVVGLTPKVMIETQAAKVRQLRGLAGEARKAFAEASARLDAFDADVARKLRHIDRLRSDAATDGARALKAAQDEVSKAGAKAEKKAEKAGRVVSQRMRVLDVTQIRLAYRNRLAAGIKKSLSDHAASFGALRKVMRQGPWRHVGDIYAGVVRPREDGSFEVDTRALLVSLKQRYPPEFVDEFIAKAGEHGAALAAVLQRPPWKSMMVVDYKQLDDIQDAVEALGEYVQRRRFDPALRAAAIITRELDLNRNAQGMGDGLALSIKRFAAKFDARQSKEGEVAEIVSETREGALDLLAGRLDEVTLLTQGAGDGEKTARMLRYIDDTDGIDTSTGTFGGVKKFGHDLGRKGTTHFNTGDETLWTRAKRNALADPEGKTLVALARIHLGSETNDQTLAALGAEARKILEADPGITAGAFVDKMKVATLEVSARKTGIDGKSFTPIALDGSTTRVVALLTATTVRAATLDDAARILARRAGGTLTPEGALAANALLTGQYARLDGVNDLGEVIGGVEDALQALETLGIPRTQREIRVSGQKLSTLLQKTSVDPTGKALYLPNAVIHAIEQRLDDITKSASRFNPVERGDFTEGSKRALFGLGRLQKQSITMGLFIPTPKYWVNNAVGDLSQIWKEEGVTTAAKLSFQNAFSMIPFFGRALQDRMADATAAAGGKDTLGTVFGALFNPHLGAMFRGDDGYVRLADGRVVSYKQMFQWALEDGILDTVAGEEMLEALSRAELRDGDSRLSRWRKTWSQDIAVHAQLVQQRQRVGLYMELMLKQGVDRRTAAKRTKNALYDWKHGFSQVEAAYLAKINVPFYRFYKLSIQQATRTFLEPFVRPDHMRRALLGQSQMARVRQQIMLARLGSSWVHENETNEAIAKEESEYFDMLSYMGLDWTGGRPTGTFSATSYLTADGDPYLLKAQGEDGRTPTHAAVVMPELTAISSAQMVVAPFFYMGAAALAGLDQTRYGSGQFVLPDDFTERILLGPGELLGPGSRDAYEMFVKGMVPGGQQPREEKIRVGAVEREFFRWVPGAEEPDAHGRVPKAQVIALSMVPVIGSEVPRLLNPWIDNPGWHKDVSTGVSFALSKKFGFGTYLFDARQNLSFQQKDANAALKFFESDATKKLQGPTPLE